MSVFERLSAAIARRKSAAHIRFNCAQAFRDVDLAGKRLLEVGAGDGVLSGYAAAAGAAHVVALEPEDAGSTEGSAATLAHIRECLGLDNLEHAGCRVQDYDCGTQRFDIVLLWNSINHLDEDSCVALLTSERARGTYVTLLRHIAGMMCPGGTAILGDCSRRNLFRALGLRHPITPQIEWQKHQSPETWTTLANSVGLYRRSLGWTVPYPLRRIAPLCGNRLAAFCLFSHFRLVLAYCPTEATLLPDQLPQHAKHAEPAKVLDEHVGKVREA